jgi:transcriptional regulator with XRE-family HTH domain
MKDRIKEIRNSRNLTQQAFADKLQIPRNNIAGYETGKRSPSDAVVSLICREFNVNEEWLRTGNGEMFKKLDREQEIALMVSTLFKEESESFKFRFIKALCNMNDAGWDALESFVDEVANKKDRDM